MDSLEKEQLARLLSRRDGPSVLEKERVLEGVLAQLDAESPRATRSRRAVRWLAFAALPALAAAAALLVIVRPQPDELVARGGDGSPSFALRCLRDGVPSPCAAGDTLAFEVAGTAQLDHVAIVGEREDGALIWYAPGPGQRSASVPSARTVLPAGARIDAEQLAGRVTVRAVFSAEPLSREQALDALAAPSEGLRVIERDLVIGAGR